MRRKLYWGLAVLIVILFTAGVFLLTQRNIDMEPEIVLGEETKQLLKDMAQQHKEVSVQDAAQDAAKPPPPGVSPNGHWHNGEWHDKPDAPVPGQTPPVQTIDVMYNGKKWSEHSPIEKANAIKQNELRIWATGDLISGSKKYNFPYLNLWEESYQLQTENPFPYTPEVIDQMRDLQWRLMEAMKKYAEAERRQRAADAGKSEALRKRVREIMDRDTEPE